MTDWMNHLNFGMYATMGAVAVFLVLGWVWIVVIPLALVVVGAGKALSQALLRSFYAHLPRRLKPHRVSVYHIANDRHSRFGPRFEKELHRILQKSAPGASACACLRDRHQGVRGTLRVWQDNRSALLDFTTPSLGTALQELENRMRDPAALAWHVGDSECTNCNSISCPLHWRQVVPQLQRPSFS